MIDSFVGVRVTAAVRIPVQRAEAAHGTVRRALPGPRTRPERPPVPLLPRWFTSVAEARSIEEGVRRVLRLKGGTVFRETIVARGPGERYACRVDETNAPGMT
ncbi:hypothetical protein ACTU45_11215 [Streptomyces sp. 24-1644]|uniref:hypothetical protein n=1 Tax=Streptomyces sp. 24-1644 TaxID=3457315 RepID=UPI003FA6E30C